MNCSGSKASQVCESVHLLSVRTMECSLCGFEVVKAIRCQNVLHPASKMGSTCSCSGNDSL